MLKPKNNKIKGVTVPNYSDDSVKIESGSIIIDNKWVSYKGTLFRLSSYINTVIKGSRTRFFKDRNFAVYLLIGIDVNEGITVIEGTHVPFTTMQAVPRPVGFTIAPLVGVIAIQDGSSDLVYGYKPLENENIQFFSGSGNIIKKNLKGAQGEPSTTYGETGIVGETGIPGIVGETGFIGVTGLVGPVIPGNQGVTGFPGMTGISWDIDIPFEDFF